MSSSSPLLAAVGWDDRVSALVADFPAEFSVGRVTRVDRGRATVVTDAGELRPRVDTPMSVGDWVGVDVVEDRIAVIAPRWSAITRRAAGLVTASQTLAANIDVVVVVQALNQAVNVRRLERELVVAWDSGARPLVVLTKADLCTDVAAEIERATEVGRGVDVVAVSVVTGDGFNRLLELVGHGRTFVIVGASGVGKSTLINYLVGADVQDTGGIRLNDGRGRHTTTAGELVQVPGGGILIDTPGLRELGLWDDDGGIAMVFGDIEELAMRCRFTDCEHRDEPDCAVRDVIESERLESWRRLNRELELTTADRAGWQKAQENKKRRAFGRAIRDQPYRK